MYHSVSAFSRYSENLFYNLGTLLDEALTNNTRDSITGVLGFADHQFVQVIEGPEAIVDALFERICADRRHSELQIDLRERCTQRVFPLWSMAFVGFEVDLQPIFNSLAKHDGPRPEIAGVMRDLAEMLDSQQQGHQYA